MFCYKLKRTFVQLRKLKDSSFKWQYAVIGIGGYWAMLHYGVKYTFRYSLEKK